MEYKLGKKAASIIVLILVLLTMGMLSLVFNIQPAKSEWTRTVYIRADGSIDPSDAPIHRDGNVYTLTDNITSSGDGIVVERNNIIIDGNGYTLQCTGDFTFALKGIHLSGRSNVTIKNINIQNFTVGIRLDYSSNITINSSNIINNGEGIHLYKSSKNSIYESSITNNGGYGILLDYSSNCSNISGNSITNNGYGVWMDCLSDNNVIRKNVIVDNGDGLILGGIGGYSVNNTIVKNVVANSRYGILLGLSSNNFVSSNRIVNCWIGIDVGSLRPPPRSYNNTIIANTLENNRAGVYLRYSSGNSIYRNNFINNTYQGSASDSINTWDDGYPGGGNYWSDYVGVDLFSGPYQNDTGSDGIEDTPYVIDENNVDRYPLMGPFNSFNVSVGYSVDVISNSTVEDFRYFESNSTIIMHVSNMTVNQTVGFCRLTIPHDVMSPPYTVKVNDTIINFQTIHENYTEGISIIYFTYEHSKLEITIIPEFPTTIILPLFMVLNLVAFVFRKKRGMKNQKCGG